MKTFNPATRMRSLARSLEIDNLELFQIYMQKIIILYCIYYLYLDNREGPR